MDRGADYMSGAIRRASHHENEAYLASFIAKNRATSCSRVNIQEHTENDNPRGVWVRGLRRSTRLERRLTS